MAARARHERARLAGITRRRPGDAEAIQAARADLGVANILDAHDALRERARALVAGWPPLTETQRARLAVLLHDVPVAPEPAQDDPARASELSDPGAPVASQGPARGAA